MNARKYYTVELAKQYNVNMIKSKGLESKK